MNKTFYSKLYNEFKLQNPKLSEKVVEWRPSGKQSIRLFLEDGYVLEFHGQLGCRRVNTYDYTKDGCKEEFRNRLNELMSDTGYDQRGLAQASGLTQGSISNYLTKKTLPDLHALRQLAKAFGCTINDLLDS